MVIIDNYDSFTFNLVHYVEEILDQDVIVMRNDEIDWNILDHSDSMILSPGPGLPNESGDLLRVIDKYHQSKKILGVCLGHQAIAEFFGAKLTNSNIVHHGVSSFIDVKKEDLLFEGLPSKLQVGRYHSWHADREHFPDDLLITSQTEDKIIMSFKHKSLPVYGVQFHPESVMTPEGKKMIENFIRA